MPEPENARGPDSSYVRELINKNYVSLQRALTKRIGDSEVASDLLHDAGCITWEKWCAGQIQRPEQIAGYIFEVAMNLRRNQRRLVAERPDRRASIEQIDRERIAAAPSAESEAEQQQIATILKALIQAMDSQRDRAVLVRLYLEGEDKESICQDLRLNARQFDRVLYRARQRLRKSLSNLGELAHLLQMQPDSLATSRGLPGLDRSYISALIQKDCISLRLLFTRYMGDAQAASNLLQDAALITLEKWCSGSIQQPEHIAGHLFRVAMTVLRNQRRSVGNRPERGASLEHLDREQIAVPSSESETKAQIAAKLKDLIQPMRSQRDRAVLVRFYLKEEEKELICRDLNLDARQFDRVLYRARQQLWPLIKGSTGSDVRAVPPVVSVNLDPTLANRYLADRLSEQELHDYEARLVSNPDAVSELQEAVILKVGLTSLRETGELDHLLRQRSRSFPKFLIPLTAGLVAIAVGVTVVAFMIGAIFLYKDVVRKADIPDLVQTANVAFHACVALAEPAVPVADSASLEQMISARKDVMAFNTATLQYFRCLGTTYQDLMTRYGGISPKDQIAKVEALRTELHNGSVLRLQNVADRFNEQVRIYNATHHYSPVNNIVYRDAQK